MRYASSESNSSLVKDDTLHYPAPLNETNGSPTCRVSRELARCNDNYQRRLCPLRGFNPKCIRDSCTVIMGFYMHGLKQMGQFGCFDLSEVDHYPTFSHHFGSQVRSEVIMSKNNTDQLIIAIKFCAATTS